MAHNLYKSETAVNLEANALGAALNSGYIRIYAGTQAANADTALSGQTLLAEFRFPSTAFGSASGGVITANAIGSVLAAATGTAAWFRCLKSDGSTVIMDGSVGTSGCDCNLGSASITSGGSVSVTGFTHTVLKH